MRKRKQIQQPDIFLTIDQDGQRCLVFCEAKDRTEVKSRDHLIGFDRPDHHIVAKFGSGKSHVVSAAVNNALREWFLPPPPRPPRFAELFLYLVPLRLRETIIGDLAEEFTADLIPKYGLSTARCLYCGQVLTEILRAILDIARGRSG
jgi:hypothetical protein